MFEIETFRRCLVWKLKWADKVRGMALLDPKWLRPCHVSYFIFDLFGSLILSLILSGFRRLRKGEHDTSDVLMLFQETI